MQVVKNVEKLKVNYAGVRCQIGKGSNFLATAELTLTTNAPKLHPGPGLVGVAAYAMPKIML